MSKSDDELLHLCAIAIEAQHNAIDLLLATLLLANPKFRPSQSGVWPAVQTGYATLHRLRARIPEFFSDGTNNPDRSQNH